MRMQPAHYTCNCIGARLRFYYNSQMDEVQLGVFFQLDSVYIQIFLVSPKHVANSKRLKMNRNRSRLRQRFMYMYLSLDKF